MNTQLTVDRRDLYRTLTILLVLVSIASTSNTQGAGDSVLRWGANHIESPVEEIRFSFHPRWRAEVLDDVFLTIEANGTAEAVFNDYEGSKITRIYKGTLPKAEVSRLTRRVRAALQEANKTKAQNGVIHEGDLFYLSVKLKNSKVQQSGGVVAGVPEVHSIVEELRVLWKQLTKTPLAYAYLKTTPIENDRLALLLKEGKLRFIPFREFPNELQPLIREAINKSFGFQALNQIQYDQLKTHTSYGELYVTDGGAGYKLTLMGRSQAKGWRGLMPLRSTRHDVEAVLGQPTTLGGSSYQTASERVYFQYSDGPCEKGWPYGWNVAPDTVVTIRVSPKIKVPLATLNLDVSKHEKWRAGHISDVVHYTNHKEGVDFEVDEFRGNVISVTYIPTAADGPLQCPDAAGRLPPGRRQADSLFKFDEYGNIPFSYERERLDLFAAQIRRQPDSEAFIIAYAGAIAYSDEAKVRADCARNYLIKKHGIKAEAVRAIDGGYRESSLVELYVEPRGGDLPLARPSVRPSKVQIIGPNKPISCDSG